MTAPFPFPRKKVPGDTRAVLPIVAPDRAGSPPDDPEADLFAHIAAVRAYLAEIGAAPDDPTLAMFEANARALLANAEATRLTREAVQGARRADDAALAQAAEAGLAAVVPGLRREIRAECAAIARGLSWGVAAAVAGVVVLACAATGVGVHLWDAAGQGREAVEVRDQLGGVFRDTGASAAAAVRLIEANRGVMDTVWSRCQAAAVRDPNGNAVCSVAVFAAPPRPVPGGGR